METVALARQPLLPQFCRSHITGVKWNTEQSFLSPPFHSWCLILIVTKTNTNDTHACGDAVAHSLCDCQLGEEWHWSEWLVHWCDGDEWEWHHREGQTWPVRLCCGFVASAQVDPREKKHIFSMCNFYYYFHFSCTYSSTVERNA